MERCIVEFVQQVNYQVVWKYISFDIFSVELNHGVYLIPWLNVFDLLQTRHDYRI